MNTTPCSNETRILRLEIRGIGHCPSFKNSKDIVTIPDKQGSIKAGRPVKRFLVITKKEYRQWMDKAVASLESQLRCEFQTRGIAITMEPSAPCSIASLLPLDDSRKWIPEHSVSTQLVSKGEEGAVIEIYRLPNQPCRSEQMKML